MYAVRNRDNGEDLVWDIPIVLQGGSDTMQYAMVILNAPIVSDVEMVKTLWNAAVLRFTVDGGTNHWLEFLRNNNAEDLPPPDCVTGDFDSITEDAMSYFKIKKVRFITTPDQDETDFTKCLRELNAFMYRRNLQLRYIIALGTNRGRIDQIMGNMETLHIAARILDEIPVILMTSSSLTWLLPAQRNHIIQVPQAFVDNNYAVGLIPLRGPTTVTTTGLKWDMEEAKLGFGEMVSTSNGFDEDIAEVKSALELIFTCQYTNEEI